jgi:hypothetical protein
LPQHLPFAVGERRTVGAEFFVNGDGVTGGWKYGHDADGSMSTLSIRAKKIPGSRLQTTGDW